MIRPELEQTAVQRIDTHVQVQRAEANEREARAGLFRALQAFVWVVTIGIAAPLLVIVGFAVTIVLAGVR